MAAGATIRPPFSDSHLRRAPLTSGRLWSRARALLGSPINWAYLAASISYLLPLDNGAPRTRPKERRARAGPNAAFEKV